MQTDVQWFVSALIDNELITLEDAAALDNELGGNAELGTFAQTFLERFVDGMNEEDTMRLQRLADGLEKAREDNAGFGMANVGERMRLNYGQRYGLKIESEYGKGTIVRILFPKET